MSLIAAYLATLSGGSGGGSPVVALVDAYVQDANSGFAEASYSLESDARIASTTTLDGYNLLGDWVSPNSAAPGSYEVRADIVSGSVTGSATGSWLALTSSRTWTIQLLGEGFFSAILTVSIRLSGVTLASCTVTLEATAF